MTIFDSKLVIQVIFSKVTINNDKYISISLRNFRISLKTVCDGSVKNMGLA